MKKPEALEPIECPICKKKFIPAPFHAYNLGYKSRRKYVCSWSCLQKSRRK